MSDELFLHFERELSYLRKLGAGFAKAHPKIAGRLRLSGDAVEDPHVSRLIESVAFLNARVRAKLDDDFPELTDALLGVLYPHLLAPVPSMAVVRFEPDPEMTAKYTVPRGAGLETDPAYGQPCRYRTVYPVVTWPIEVRGARLDGAPFRAPPAPERTAARAVLQLTLACAHRGTSFGALGPERLRFFLTGDPKHVHELYRLVFNHTVGVAVAASTDDPQPALLAPDCIRQVGFERDEGLLPYSGRAALGHRLLTEYFAFPAKFLFVDVTRLPAHKLGGPGDELCLFLYLDDTSPELEHALGPESFALGCTPVVNLFPRAAEPIQIDQTRSEVQVVPDARQPLAHEVWSVDSVRALSRDGRKVTFRPFYGIDHGQEDGEVAYWSAARRPAPPSEATKDDGTEVLLSLVDLSGETASFDDWVLMTETTCLNRDLPNKLPFGGGHPRLEFSEGGGPVRAVHCLTAPTPTRRIERGRGALWRLVSQLSLNHVALSDDREGAAALREILRIHDVVEGAETRDLIDGVLGVESRETAMRIESGGLAGICRGTEVTLRLDEKRLATSGLFLFACVLERFLASSCTLNTFVQVNLETDGRKGVLSRWKPRSGTRALL